MKTIIFTLLCMAITKGQLETENGFEYTYFSMQEATYSDLPEPENVLVVYNNNNDSIGDMSREIKNYYMNKRNIPALNTVALTIPPWKIYNGSIVFITNYWELIVRDDTCAGSIYAVCDTLTWHFFTEFIANPIRDSLASKVNAQGDTLKNKIKYILLCKGIPLKIQSGHPWIFNANNQPIAHNTRINVSIEALLCLLNNDIMSIYNNPQTPVLYPIGNGIFGNNTDPVRGNPYYNVDPNLTFNYRFKSNHFTSTSNWKLSYLVSRLDGNDLMAVKKMIDGNCLADKSGAGYWVFDNDISPVGGWTASSSIYDAYESINLSGFNSLYDNQLDWIVSSPGHVIGYVSHGANSSRFPNLRMPPTYILDTLNFEYKNGALFNSWESFNGYSYNFALRNLQGLLTDFIYTGGSSGAGHTWEPYVFGAQRQMESFLSYAIGYNLIDAIYQGIPFLGWQSTIVGDPLTTIAWGKQTLTQNLTLNDTNLVTGEITIPTGKILTISSDAVINFKHLGSITVNGTLAIQPGAKMNFNSGKSITINGTFNAVGNTNQKIEFDFTSPTSGNGIIVSPDAVINISNAVIKNAQFGISLDRVEPTIQDCEFMNCTYGIFLNESNYEISTYEGTRIINNKFTNNNSGITLDNSSPLITGNEFTGNSTSVQCLNNSNAYFGDYIEPGMNSFHDNLASDVYASYSSPTLGLDLGGGEYIGGYNSFENVQEYFVIAENSSIEAGLNWWGEAPPNENLFFTENGYIELRPWLENPLSSPQQQNTNNKFAVSSPTSVTLFDSTWSIRKKINHAYKLLTSDEKIAGRRILKDVINNYPDSALSFRAMSLFIHSCNMRTEKDTLKKFLQLLVNHQNQKEIHRYAALRLAEMKRETYLTNVNKLIAANPSSEIMDLLYYSKFNHYYFYEKNKSLAREVMDKMTEKFPFSLMTKTAKQLLEVHQSNKVVQNTITVNSEKEISISNFPNPFNPTTTINFTIPRSTDYQSVQKVTLKIYDVLGREVAQLVNEELKAGNHTATFNASHLSSSVYFCTLKTDRHISTIKLLLMK